MKAIYTEWVIGKLDGTGMSKGDGDAFVIHFVQ